MRTFASIAVAYLLAAAVLWGAFGLFARLALRRGVDPLLAALLAIAGATLFFGRTRRAPAPLPPNAERAS